MITLTRSAEARAGEILPRLPRAILVELHREQRAAGRQRAREPDAGVADRGADFEDAPGPRGGREHAQQRPHLGVDQRKVAFLADARDVPQHRVALPVEGRQVAFDGFRNDFPHN